MSIVDDDFDEEFDDDEPGVALEGNRIDDPIDDHDDDDEVEVGAVGNRIVGARAKAVVEHVARSLTEDSDAIEVDLEERRGEVQLLIHASPDDMGRLIGRRGRVIQAMRQVVRAAGAVEGVKATVDVAE